MNQSTENLDIKNNKYSKLKKIAKECFDLIVVPVLLALFCSKILIVNATIPSSSMEDTILPGDRIIGLRLAYLFQEPEREDIIIFRFPDDESQVFIKRVIGLPEETLRIIDGRVYVNGSDTPLEEIYVKELPRGSFGPYKVPKDSYFVMGDNRSASSDSRMIGLIKKSDILGTASFRIFPFNAFGSVK